MAGDADPLGISLECSAAGMKGWEKWRLSLTRMRFVSVYSKGQDAVELRVF